jgi:hypothetical protein
LGAVVAQFAFGGGIVVLSYPNANVINDAGVRRQHGYAKKDYNSENPP